MFLALNKKIMWCVVLWFAVLQAISPFIHGHIETDSPSQGHGLHMHVLQIQQVHDGIHVLKKAVSVHTVGIDDALVKGMDLLPSPLFSVLFILFLFACATGIFNSTFIFPSRLPLYLRPQSNPRAPPVL